MSISQSARAVLLRNRFLSGCILGVNNGRKLNVKSL